MDEREIAYIVGRLHIKWKPHKGQISPISYLFRHQFKLIFMECGRKFGKTELLLYMLWRWANTHPGTANYYFAPYQKQAKELIWANRRLQSFGPSQFIRGKPNNTELRITYTNGSFIKLDGSDNYEAYRGVGKGMGLVVYEEFKDFRPEFHMAFGPNIADNNSPLVIAGTPPETDSDFTVMADQIKEDEEGLHLSLPTWLNPYIDKKWLAKEKRRLYARAEGDVWEREYGAKRVRGGPSAIFPMFNRHTMTRPHHEMLRLIFKDRHKMTWLAVADPGTATCFCILYMVVNPYSKTVYVLDEIYETNQKETSTGLLVPRHRARKTELCPLDVDWLQPCDEAAAWFINEANVSFGEYFFPTEKSVNKKEEGLSLIKDQMLSGRLFISDRCTKLAWEIENYVKDKTGKVPKENDHAIDCLRYGNAAAGLNLIEEAPPVPAEPEERLRFHTPYDDIIENSNMEEWQDYDF